MQQPVEPEMSIRLFISYAEEDQELCKKLEEHLSPLKHSKKIATWHNQEIPAGAN